MELESHQSSTYEGYVDWKNRPALRGRHGGMLAASFVLVVEITESLAFLASACNLVLYLRQFMHLSPSKAANNVTNFMGTAFLLALLGGFLSDAVLTTYHIYLISAVIEFLGLIILTIQARAPSLMPPPCESSSLACQEVNGAKAAMLFGGLYLVALGVGGLKGSLPAHGAEQFDENSPSGRKQRSTFFNYFVFCLSCGALIAVTFVVWVEDNKGWQWGFGISTISIFVSILVFLAGSFTYRNKIPSGSPLTTIFKVLLAAASNSCINRNSGGTAVTMTSSPSNPNSNRKESEDQETRKTSNSAETLSNSLKFLNNAVATKPVRSSLEC